MIKRNMTIEQYSQVIDWCRENKHRIQSEEWTQSKAIKEATAVLGYEIPVTTMRRCADIAKVKWANKRPEPQPVPIDREAIIILIGALHGLYIETSGTVPENLQILKSTYVQNQNKEDEAN